MHFSHDFVCMLLLDDPPPLPPLPHPQNSTAVACIWTEGQPLLLQHIYLMRANTCMDFEHNRAAQAQRHDLISQLLDYGDFIIFGALPFGHHEFTMPRFFTIYIE